jgi:hypothetical protein
VLGGPHPRKAGRADNNYSVAAWRRAYSTAQEVCAMKPMQRILLGGTVAAALGVLPLTSAALSPAVALMIKQIVQDAVTTSLKDILLGSLRDMGCKGIALSNGLAALDARGGGAAALRGMAGGLPGLPGAGGAMPTSGMPGMADLARMLPPGTALPPEQAAMLAQMQRAMAQPLSPAQTLATMDEMVELGLLPRPIQAEMKECMVLLPQTASALGMGMGLLQPMLPELRAAREQMRALPPAEQEEMAALMAQELKAVPAAERALFLEQIDAGFFPPAVAAGVKARLTRP